MKEEFSNWLETERINLKISKEFFHHHAFEIVNAYPELASDFRFALEKSISIEPRIKKTKNEESKGIKAEKLNKEIRKLLTEIPGDQLKFEVFEENGVFYFSEEKSSIGGFDFAILNHYNNIVSLRNLCFGQLQYADGLNRWKNFLKKNPELEEIAENLKNASQHGKNIEKQKHQNETPLIVGEIQFGNWALAYRDFFKVLKADVQNSVDCLIYIVATDELEFLLSDGIVTFEKAKKIIEDFSKVISVPIWLIGIDAQVG